MLHLHLKICDTVLANFSRSDLKMCYGGIRSKYKPKLDKKVHNN